ncbi:hypothetical protein XENOCAPTIV_002262 [Xenoophorus captivus]|uniref:Uncharacterized protein n=1 Tax=Xenoophorus captivus TaxID=1517983 RepID=A0ABV0SCU5_9TELE
MWRRLIVAFPVLFLVLLTLPRQQCSAIEQILKNSEKNLGEICTILASYTRKTAKLRNKADLLVATLFDFSHTEDPEFQIGLKNLAEDLAMVQDYRHAQVRGILDIYLSQSIMFLSKNQTQ